MPVINEGQLQAANLKGADHCATISLILDHSEPGQGPRLHCHPYDETWVVIETRVCGVVDPSVQCTDSPASVGRGYEHRRVPGQINGYRESRCPPAGHRARASPRRMIRSGHARTTPTAAHEPRQRAEAPDYTAVPPPRAVALAPCQPGRERIAGPNNRGFGNHNAFRRGTRTATIETVPSRSTPITAARTAIPARRVHRAMRVRATNAPARTRASSDAR